MMHELALLRTMMDKNFYEDHKGIRFPDIGIPSLKIDIEYDGSYWHDKEKDKIRQKKLEGVGWLCITFFKLIKHWNESSFKFKILDVKACNSDKSNLIRSRESSPTDPVKEPLELTP